LGHGKKALHGGVLGGVRGPIEPYGRGAVFVMSAHSASQEQVAP